MKFLIVVLSLIVIASAAPAPQSRFDELSFEEPEPRPRQNDVNPADIITSIIRSLVSATPREGSSLGSSLGSSRSTGGEGNLLRILISLVASEFGLGGLGDFGTRGDGIDQEVFLRNLIRTFTSIVGNVLLN